MKIVFNVPLEFNCLNYFAYNRKIACEDDRGNRLK